MRISGCKIVALLAASTPAVASSGCINFEKQTMVFVFPKETSEVRALLVYEGIGVDGTGAKDLQKAKEQFERFVTKQQEFCLGGNWIEHFSSIAEPDDKPTERRFKAFLRNHIAIQNGCLYRNDAGKLCGYQTVTIKDGAGFFTELNQFVTEWMKEYFTERAQKKNGPDALSESEELLKDAVNRRATWLEMEPGRFSAHLPLTASTIRKLKRELLVEPFEAIRDEVSAIINVRAKEPDSDAGDKLVNSLRGRNEEYTAMAELVAAAPVSIDQRHHRLTVSIGVGNGEPIVLSVLAGKPRPRDQEIVGWAESLKVPVRNDVTTEKLINEFIKAR